MRTLRFNISLVIILSVVNSYAQFNSMEWHSYGGKDVIYGTGKWSNKVSGDRGSLRVKVIDYVEKDYALMVVTVDGKSVKFSHTMANGKIRFKDAEGKSKSYEVFAQSRGGLILRGKCLDRLRNGNGEYVTVYVIAERFNGGSGKYKFNFNLK